MVALENGHHLVRLPNELDVPLTPRIQRLIETASFQRLRRISQLGLVSLVYPGACHSRFEHSLGVYRNALLFLHQLRSDERFQQIVSPELGETFIVAALLHDIGHWPYCHPIEDLRLPGVVEHEQLAANYLHDPIMERLLRDDWQVTPESVLALIQSNASERGQRLIQSLLSGPIDIDKLDYLYRDSLHAGIPYGKHFDRARLIASLCVNETGDGLALTSKGKTAAELMVFARYVMFSEVYWHHTVRSATAMLQRSFFRLQHLLHDPHTDATCFRNDDADFQQTLLRVSQGNSAAKLVDGLFGGHRTIYKQIAEYSLFDAPELYQVLAHRPYAWLTEMSENLCQSLARRLGRTLETDDVLIDAPPVGLEVQFNVQIREANCQAFRSLGDVSPVVKVLAQRQFDDFVKRVRIVVHPRWRSDLENSPFLEECVQEAVVATR